jgi:hypothetical protein
MKSKGMATVNQSSDYYSSLCRLYIYIFKSLTPCHFGSSDRRQGRATGEGRGPVRTCDP